MNYASAASVHVDQIPNIDITDLRNNVDAKAVADRLIAASRDPGFIYISGHGIPDDVMRMARDSAYGFFHSSETDKGRVSVSPQHRGWIGSGGARMQDDAKADLKESFVWGFETADGYTPSDHPLRGANQWPDSGPSMRSAAMAYFHHAERVACDLMRGFAIGLNLAPDFFLKSCDVPLSRASFVWYPPQHADAGVDRFGVGPHTDFGVLTVLCQDDVGGLQVQDINGHWIEAPPIEGTLVVNVGDLLSRWTDGFCKSTPHRVVNRSGRERLSLVLAFDPEPDTVIDPREVFGVDHIANVEPTTCGDYLLWRFERAFAYRKQEVRE